MAKNSRSQYSRYSGHLPSARKSSSEDLISTIQIRPWPLSPITSARRPVARVNSVSVANPAARRRRQTPFCTINAVSDCRPSAGSSIVTLASLRFALNVGPNGSPVNGRYWEDEVTGLLALSRAIDMLTRFVGYHVRWLILAAIIVSAVHA